MTSVLPIAVSGLLAAKQSAGIRASNIAGAGVTSNPEAGIEAYKAKDPVQVSVEGGGVKTRAVDRQPTTVERYSPYSAQRVETPNVSYEEEVVGLKQAINAYKAAAAVIRTEDDLNRELLETI